MEAASQRFSTTAGFKSFSLFYQNVFHTLRKFGDFDERLNLRSLLYILRETNYELVNAQ